MLFSNVDRELEKIGFKKVEENKYGVWYERVINDFQYVHEIGILYKLSGNHIIQSYQKDVNSEGFNNMAPITYQEMKFIMKKFKQMKRRYKWR